MKYLLMTLTLLFFTACHHPFDILFPFHSPGHIDGGGGDHGGGGGGPGHGGGGGHGH